MARSRYSWLLVLLAFLCVLLPTSTANSEEVLLSIKDGILYFQSYEIPLTDVDKPVLIQRNEGNIQLQVQTPGGTELFDLGPVVLSVVQSAAQYVTVETVASTAKPSSPKATAKPTADIRQQDPCPLCGKSNFNGGHICPLCGKPFCKHDESACLRIANPAKTPIPTKNAEGKSVTYYAAPDGSHVQGGPGANTIWRPDSFITPSPSPTPSWVDYTPPPTPYE